MSTLYSNSSGSALKQRRRSTAAPRALAQITEDQKQEIAEAFELFDANKDNSLDYHEFRISMQALGFDLKKQEVIQLMHEHSTNKDGTLIDREAFEQIAAEKISRKDPLDDVRRAFKLFDDDNTGRINMRNLRRVCKELGENLDDEEIQAMIDEFDLDCDGEINEEEFINIMTAEM